MEPSRCYGYPWTGLFYAVVELALLGKLSSHELATLINILARYINKFDNETNDFLQVGRLYSKLFSYFTICRDTKTLIVIPFQLLKRILNANCIMNMTCFDILKS